MKISIRGDIIKNLQYFKNFWRKPKAVLIPLGYLVISVGLIFSSFLFFYSSYYEVFRSYQSQNKITDIAVSSHSPFNFNNLQNSIDSEFENDKLQGYYIQARQYSSKNYTVNANVSILYANISLTLLNFSSQEFCQEFLNSHNNLIAGRFPENTNEVVFYLNDISEYSLGIGDQLNFPTYNLTIVGIIEDSQHRQGLHSSLDRMNLIFLANSFEDMYISQIFSDTTFSYFFYFNYAKFDIFNPFRLSYQFTQQTNILNDIFEKGIETEFEIANLNKNVFNDLQFRQFWKTNFLYLIKILIPIVVLSLIALKIGFHHLFLIRDEIWEGIEYRAGDSTSKKIIISEIYVLFNIFSLTIGFGLSFCFFNVVTKVFNFSSQLYLSNSFFFFTFLLIEIPFGIFSLSKIKERYRKKSEWNRKKSTRKNHIAFLSLAILFLFVVSIIFITLIYKRNTLTEIRTNGFFSLGKVISEFLIDFLLYFPPILFAVIFSQIGFKPLIRLTMKPLSHVFTHQKITKKPRLTQIFVQMGQKEQIMSIFLIISLCFGSIMYNEFLSNQELTLDQNNVLFDCGTDYQVLSDQFDQNCSFTESLRNNPNYKFTQVNVCVVERPNLENQITAPNIYILLQVNFVDLAYVLESDSQIQSTSSFKNKYNTLLPNEILASRKSVILHSSDFFTNFTVFSSSTLGIQENESRSLSILGEYFNFPFNYQVSSIFPSKFGECEVILISPLLDIDLVFPSASKKVLFYIDDVSEINSIHLNQIVPFQYVLLKDLNVQLDEYYLSNSAFLYHKFIRMVSILYVICVVFFSVLLVREYLQSTKKPWDSLVLYGISNYTLKSLNKSFFGLLLPLITILSLGFIMGFAFLMKYITNFFRLLDSNLIVNIPIITSISLFPILTPIIVICGILFIIFLIINKRKFLS